MRRVRVTTALFVCLTGFAQADTFVVPLEVSRVYTMGQQVPFEFDLGVALLQVHEVRFTCEGSITAGVDYWGDPFSWCFQAWLRADPGYWVANGPYAGATTWPMPEPFSGESEFRPLGGGTTWDFLLDGHATGWVELPVLYFIPETPPQQVPYGFLHTASLIIEAEPVLLGDFEPDGDVDFYDFAVLALAWRSSSGNGNWNPDCDISSPNDDLIDERDLAVLVNTWLAGVQ